MKAAITYITVLMAFVVFTPQGFLMTTGIVRAEGVVGSRMFVCEVLEFYVLESGARLGPGAAGVGLLAPGNRVVRDVLRKLALRFDEASGLRWNPLVPPPQSNTRFTASEQVGTTSSPFAQPLTWVTTVSPRCIFRSGLTTCRSYLSREL